MSYKAILVPAVGTPRWIDIQTDEEGSSLKSLQEIVGGYIEGVELKVGDEECTGYFHEEGKIKGLQINGRATGLCQVRNAIYPHDYIAGDMVIVGPENVDDDEEAISTSPPEEIFDEVSSIACYP
jgi:hypothetical protein